MRVFIISLRKLIWVAAAVLILLVAGIVLLVTGPFETSGTYKQDKQSVAANAKPASNPFASPKPNLALDVKLEGTTADLKLITENFQFVRPQTDANAQPVFGQGHAHLYLDGKLIDQLDEPEVLLKRLPKGEHELRVELVYSNHVPYKIEASKTIQVQ